MKKFDWKYVPIFVIFALSMALAPVFRAQDQGSLTRITPVPDGRRIHRGWPNLYARFERGVAGGQQAHVLWVPDTTQIGHLGMKYVFRGWEFAGGSLRSNPVTMTASPAIPEYRASFDVFYGLGLSFFNLPGSHALPDAPGTIYVNGKRHTIRRTMCTWRRIPQWFCRRSRIRDLSSWDGSRAQTR